MSVRCSSRAGSCSSWLMLSNPTKIKRVCRFGVGFFYGRKKVKREKSSSCWWKIVINRSTCTILFLSTPRGACYCCSCPSLPRLRQQNPCQEGGCEIPRVRAAARQRLGGVFLFFHRFFPPASGSVEVRRQASVGCASKGHLTLHVFLDMTQRDRTKYLSCVLVSFILPAPK